MTDDRIESRLLDTRRKKESLMDIPGFKGSLEKSHYRGEDEMKAMRQLNEVAETTLMKE